MKNPFRRKTLTDEQVDKLLKKYLIEMPADIEKEAKKSMERATESNQAPSMAGEESGAKSHDVFDEQLKKVIKARIDLQIEKEQFQEEKEAFGRSRVRGRRVKMVAGACAMFAALILIPMTSQSAKGWLHNVSLEIFPEEDEVMNFTNNLEQKTRNEDEAWAYIKDAIYAKRMYFNHMGDEWCFEEGIYDSSVHIRMRYKLYGEEVRIRIGERNGQDAQSVATSGGSCLDEQTFVGHKDSCVRMYAYETEEGIPRCGAEIIYENALYVIQSSVDYDEFQKLIVGITFEE